MTTTRGPTLLAPLALLPGLLLAACTTSSSPETTLAFIELVPRAMVLHEGGTRRLTVIGTYSDGSVLPLDAGVTLSSSEAARATVGADGTVTAVAAGEVTILATASGRTAECLVTVAGPVLQSIAVTMASTTLEVGATQALTVTAAYDYGPTRDVTANAIFSSSDGTKVALTAAPGVTALVVGSSTITAYHGGKTSTAVVTVVPPTLQSIALTLTTGTMPEGSQQAVRVEGTYSSGPTRVVTASATYTTSAASVARVDASGVVTAVAPGTATITAAYQGKTDTAAVTVTARALQSIAVLPGSFALSMGATQALTVNGTYDAPPNPTNVTSLATYTSSATSVARVSATGVVTAVAAGTATITTTYLGKTAAATVTVNAPTSIVVTPPSVGLAANDTSALNVTAIFAAPPDLNVTALATYTSSAESVATVDAAGVVRAVADGTATITASFGGQTDTAVVTVITPPNVSIADNVPGATATGDVTFTFTFSQDVGTSFDAADVTVTGGTKGAFARSSATVYTLVVVPTASATGTITVSVAAGAFASLANVLNTTGATASQAYDTRGGGGAAWPTMTFEPGAVTWGLTGFGDEVAALVADPTNAANQVVKLDKPATSPLWAGTTLSTSTSPADSVATIPFTATAQKMTVRVWSPDAGIQVRLKVEDATNPTHSVETEATVTTAGAWQTLTFDFANQAAGTAAINLAFTYNKVSVFMNFGVDGATAGAKTYYVDDVTFLP